jgi:DNA-binding response OmpR family regulator
VTEPTAKTEPLRILLVEDEALIALDTQDVLESAGYTVVGPADRVDRALALAAAWPIDAAVLDVNLAGVQVWPVAESLHQRGIPFLLLSGLATTSAVPANCAKAPRVSKPIMSKELLEALAAILRAEEREQTLSSVPSQNRDQKN